MRIFIMIYFLVSVSGFAQKNAPTPAEHYKTKNFDAAIFPETKDLLLGTATFRPTKKEIEIAESALKEQLSELSSNRVRRVSAPIIHENLEKYRRQYFGYIDTKGNKILFINAIWKDSEFGKDWLKQEIFVDDGGSFYWNIKYDLTAGKLFELAINGHG